MNKLPLRFVILAIAYASGLLYLAEYASQNASFALGLTVLVFGFGVWLVGLYIWKEIR